MKPVINWSGSKREQAHDIVSYIPDKFYETYYEPFCGGCSILAYIIERKNLSKHFKSFICCSFDEINASKNDFVYLDPPYQKTKGMHFGSFDNMPLFSFLERLESDWMLSYDGIAGNNNLISDVPKNLYKKHLLINSGNSSFRRVIGNNKYCNVQESLYLSFEPKSKFVENLF